MRKRGAFFTSSARIQYLAGLPWETQFSPGGASACILRTVRRDAGCRYVSPSEHLMNRYTSDAIAILYWIVQQVLVLAAALVWMLLTGEIPRSFSTESSGTLAEALVLVAVTVVPFFAIGGVMHVDQPGRLPGLSRSGRWIWVLPACFFLNSIASSLRYWPFATVMSELLFPPLNGEAWWAVMFVTYPCLCCLGYSLGVVAAQLYLASNTKAEVRKS